MLRRLLPTIGAMAAGFAVLLAGLLSLVGVFRQERDDARDSLAQQRQAVELYAQRALFQRLDAAWRNATESATATLSDPLLADHRVLWIEAGERRLPLPSHHRPGTATPARELFAALVAGSARRPANGSPAGTPWNRQLELLQRVDAGLRRDDDNAVARAVRSVLRHRARYRLAPELDLPSVLALLHRLVRDSSPSPELLAAVLRDGIAEGEAHHLEDLPRSLLRHRTHFTEPDFRFLAERLVEVAETAELPYQSFLERVRAEPVTLPEVPVSLPGSTLLDHGRWLAAPRPPDTVVAIEVELRDDILAVGAEMQRRGLLAADADIQPVALPAHLPLADLELRVDSPSWPRRLADVEARYRWKVGLVALCAVLAAVMASLALALQARRLRLVELKSDFVATVSHELRTPLASVRLLAETVARRATGPEVKDYPQRIVHEIDGLTFLVDNILSFNRLDKGRIELRHASLHLDELIDSVRSELEPHVDRRLEISSRGGDLRADPDLLRLLLLNLARNACLYSSRDPIRLDVTHRTTASGHEILVRDNGWGIEPADQQHVFAEFYQPRQRHGRRGGTGLGLAICRRVAELHGGSITIRTSSPRGTTFQIELPA